MTARRPPNILLVMADQLSAPALPIHGHPVVQAPHLSRLAEEGVVFENCYCNFPICAPSRASMHAGVLPLSLGCYDNAAEFRAEIPTLAHHLGLLGYRTVLCGKMHFVGPDQLHGYHERPMTEIYPSNFAWTVDWSKGREWRPTNLTMAPVIESGPCVRTMQMDYDEEVEHHALWSLRDLARAPDRRPFLLTVSFTHPHSPFVISREYWDRYRHDDIDMPATGDVPPEQRDTLSRNLYYCHARHLFTVTDEHVRSARHGYYGMVSYIDDKVGRLVGELDTLGLADETVIVFTSDHGEMLGERGMWYKQHFWEWAARVPLVFRDPGRWKARRVGEVVSLVDLMPTLLGLAGGDPAGLSPPVDGHDMSGLLDGHADGWPDIAISEYTADGSTGPSRMVRKGAHKYMEIEGVDRLLFNLETDPRELRNLADDPEHAGEERELREILRDGWDAGEVRERVLENQRRRLLIHRVTKGDPSYVPIVRADDARRYVRNTGAADAKARARLPYVAPAQPDKGKGTATRGGGTP